MQRKILLFVFNFHLLNKMRLIGHCWQNSGLCKPTFFIVFTPFYRIWQGFKSLLKLEKYIFIALWRIRVKNLGQISIASLDFVIGRLIGIIYSFKCSFSRSFSNFDYFYMLKNPFITSNLKNIIVIALPPHMGIYYSPSFISVLSNGGQLWSTSGNFFYDIKYHMPEVNESTWPVKSHEA